MKQKPRLLDLRKHIGQVQELRAKLQIKKGSILVYTLIVMMIMLATALSIFAVAVREKKSAGTTAASMQAFAVADSGSEIALNKIANVSTLNEVGSCADGGIVTGSIGAGMDYTLTFYDSGGNQLLNCTDSVSAVDKVKSVGRYGGTARAVEVAVAQTVGSWIFKNDACLSACTASVSCPSGLVIVGYKGMIGNVSAFTLGEIDNISGAESCTSVTLGSSTQYSCKESRVGGAYGASVAIICSQ